jgi:hypothetical protein
VVPSHINYSIPEQDRRLQMQVAQGKLSTSPLPHLSKAESHNLSVVFAGCTQKIFF